MPNTDFLFLIPAVLVVIAFVAHMAELRRNSHH